MKVRDLIEKLKKFDQDSLIMVEGYEGGVDTPYSISKCYVKLDQYNMGKEYLGNYETCEDPDQSTIKAVVIWGK